MCYERGRGGKRRGGERGRRSEREWRRKGGRREERGEEEGGTEEKTFPFSFSCSELAKAGGTELQSRLEQVAGERDSTLTRAQEMADKLVEAEKERDSLQVCVCAAYYQQCCCLSCLLLSSVCGVPQEIVVKSSSEIDRLQDELEEITKK